MTRRGCILTHWINFCHLFWKTNTTAKNINIDDYDNDKNTNAGINDDKNNDDDGNKPYGK